MAATLPQIQVSAQVRAVKFKINARLPLATNLNNNHNNVSRSWKFGGLRVLS
ncbi:hypothetical protein Leryth_023743 [Lithospermum erythrorhizon]|nr:hypothetical protein Leryth_023743 [Lithospermum erythrorhizon]